MHEDELSVVRAIELQLSKGFRPVAIERWLRVCADSMRRITETETDWWRSEVEMPMLEGGMSTSQMLEAQADYVAQVRAYASLLQLSGVVGGRTPRKALLFSGDGGLRWV